MKNHSLKLIIILFLSFLIIQPAHSLAATNFNDIHSDYWAYNEIQYLVGKRVIQGYSNGNFGPNNTINRIQAAIMLVRSLGLSTQNRPDPGFKDVRPGDPNYAVVATVAAEGILSGVNGNFEPYSVLTRAQMAKILAEAYHLKYVFEANFTDVSKSSWSYGYINSLYSNGITTGYTNNTFRPNDKVTRTQFAVFMARTLDPEFKQGIVFESAKAQFTWNTDDSLVLHIPVTNHYTYAVTNIKANLAVSSQQNVVAEGSFNFGSSFSLKPLETKIITIQFNPDTVYYVEKSAPLFLNWTTSVVKINE